MTGMKKSDTGEYEIDLLQIFRALLRRIWIILLVAVVCAAVGYIGTRVFITPKYSAVFTAYVNNHNTSDVLTSLTSSDMSARATLANTTAKIATSTAVLEDTARRSSVNVKDIEVTTGVDTSSAILTVRTIMKDQAMVAEVAKNLSEVLTDAVARIVEGSSLQIIDRPQPPEGRYSPSYSRNAIIAGLIGLIIVCLIIIIIELRDDTLKEASDLEERYGIPVIGSIPDMDSTGKKKGYGKGYGYGYGYGGRN